MKGYYDKALKDEDNKKVVIDSSNNEIKTDDVNNNTNKDEIILNKESVETQDFDYNFERYTDHKPEETQVYGGSLSKGAIIALISTMVCIIMTIVGALMGGKLTGWCFRSILLLLYLALISSVAYSVWGILLKHNPVGKVAIYSFTNPIFSVLLSFVFLHETSSFGLELIVALGLVCCGMWRVNRVKE